jgi:D-alanyl-D-alanine carboxypeptidase
MGLSFKEYPMKSKRLVCLLLVAAYMLIFYQMAICSEKNNVPLVENIPFEVNAKAAVLMAANTGQYIFEKNSHDKLPIASITKIMTMLLIMEALYQKKITLDDVVTVSEHASSMGGSQVYLAEGEEFTVHDLLKAVAIHSANDASVALAEHIAGSENVFVTLMNEKAKELAMNNTYFLDCSGLTDEGHYSTANDIAIMARELITKYPSIYEYTTIKRDTFRSGTFGLDNTNHLIGKYRGMTGLKTGVTGAAGYCLAATASRDGMDLISVVLGVESNDMRFSEAAKILDYGFSNYEIVNIDKKGVVLLVLSSVTKCIKVPCLFCLLLLIISIFLIIAGIISLLLVDIVIGLIFIGLGVISTILTALCLFINLCCVTVHKGHI